MKEIALIIDYENILYSTQNIFSEYPDFSIIINMCKAHGRIASAQAFADWTKLEQSLPFLFKYGIQPVFTPLSKYGKSSCDTAICVNAMKLFYEHTNLSTLILVSGDRDYLPLVVELRARGIQILLLGVKDTISKDLINVSDGFIEYTGKNIIDEQKISVEKGVEDNLKEIVLKAYRNSTEKEWVNLAKVGYDIKQIDRNFNHRKYGYDKLINLIKDTDLFEISYSEDGLVAYIKLKQGSPSSSRPADPELI